MCGPYTLAIILGLAAGGVITLVRPGDYLFAAAMAATIATLSAGYVWFDQRGRR